MSSNWLPYLKLQSASPYHRLGFLKLHISRLLPPIILILLFLLCDQFCLILWSHGLLPISLLCQSDFPSRNTGMDCRFLLQGIFLTQQSNPSLLCLLPCRWILYHWVTWEAPVFCGRYTMYTFSFIFLKNSESIDSIVILCLQWGN